MQREAVLCSRQGDTLKFPLEVLGTVRKSGLRELRRIPTQGKGDINLFPDKGDINLFRRLPSSAWAATVPAMPRAARNAPGGYVYHALNRANGRLPLFESPGDYAAFERVLAEAAARVPGARLLAYCVMPNHWHLALWPRADGELSEFLRILTLTHAQRWHAHRGSAGAGHVYQGRFKSFPVQRDDHFLTLCRYVERNPLRAGLVRRAERWRWSSLWRREFGGGGESGAGGRGGAGGTGAGARGGANTDAVDDGKTDADRLLPPLHEPWPVDRPSDWARMVNMAQTAAEEAAVLESIRRSRPLGADPWVRRTAAKLGLEWTLRPRGRPRNDKRPPADG